MKNLPNFTLIFCRIFVVAGIAVEASVRREVGRSGCSLSVVADKRHLMAERCNFGTIGRVVLDGLAVGIDFVGVGFGRVELGAGEFSDLRLQPRQRLSFEVQLACNYR